MINAAKKSADASDFSTEEKIKALYELQKIESQIDEINRLKGELPFEVQDLEDEVAGLDTRIKNLTQEADEQTRAAKNKREEIEEAKAKIAKYEAQQENVRNNREYESLSKEIEYQNLEIELCEKNIKEFNAEVKARKKQIEEAKAALAERKLDLEAKKAELASIDEETAKDVAELTARSEEVTKKIDNRLLNAYRNIRKNMRNGLAVVMVKRDACGGCFNRIPPQRQLDIRMSKKIIVCEYCGRILVSDLLEEKTKDNQ